jgi:hypothetical protein
VWLDVGRGSLPTRVPREVLEVGRSIEEIRTRISAKETDYGIIMLN